MSGAPRRAPVVCANETAVGELAAELILNRLAARPAVRMLLPAGRTPDGMYAALRGRGACLAGATVLQLDEYAGVPPDDERSFARYLRTQLDGLQVGALHTLDGSADDLGAEAARHASLIAAAPVDLAVLGLGLNGHVAFDEPGSEVSPGVQVVPLSGPTRDVAARAMHGAAVPERGITTGLGTLLACREVILIVTGAHKAEILRAVLSDPPSGDRPASLLRAHPRLTVLCDPEAASALELGPREGVVVVLGHREPGISEEHRISRESLERLQRAERIVHRRPARAVVLTGYTTTDGLSEAEQMAAAWGAGDVPLLLEVAGRNTAENASRTWPLLQAIGGVRSVTVVTSFWHLRTRFFFDPYERRGLHVVHRREWRGGGWARLLADEARKAPLARGERRAAWAAQSQVPERMTRSTSPASETTTRSARPPGRRA
jgi:glucosamine-6-phosphate deaminase